MLAKKTAHRGRRRPRRENTSYWMSYSDILSALLLMFVLMLFLSFNRYMILHETKEAELATKETQLQAQEEKISAAQEELKKYEEELAATRSELNEQRVELDEKDTELAGSREDLDASLAKLTEQQRMIEEQEHLLALSQEDIETVRAQLDEYSKELESRENLLSAKDAALLMEQLRVVDLETLIKDQNELLKTQAGIDELLVGIRARIITQLRNEFDREGVNVTVDSTGAITMDSTVFFDTDRTLLTADGREMLSQVLPIYFKTLMSPENVEFVSEIIIEGHTDSVGSYEHNLSLSQRRAQAVVNFCMGQEFTGLSADEKLQLRTMLSANGRADSQLIYDVFGAEDKAASRRVEIKFRLKDAEMVEQMVRILTGFEE